MDQFLERLIPPCRSFFPLLAEFPSGVWIHAKPANFALASKTHTRRCPRRGTLRYSSGRGWPMYVVQSPCLGVLLVFHINQVIWHLFLH